MTNRAAANRYARALLDVAVAERADVRAIEQQLNDFVRLFQANPALEKVLVNPAVPAPRKRAVIVELTARAKTQTVLAKLLALLAERDRLVLLSELAAAYSQRLLDHLHVVRAEVTTAVPLGPERAKAIEQGLAQMTGRTVALSTRVDPEIIGGVVTRIGSTVYDGSVTRQLQKMKQSLVGQQ
jgi:F-type H+-transporting ATPase subunit delta